MKRQRFLSGILVLVLFVPLATAGAADPNGPDADFDGDRYADLAIGVPYETLQGPPTSLEGGAVSILYGSPPDGLSGLDDQFWSQNSTDVADEAED